MLKLLGIGLVLSGCIGVGWYCSGKAMQRIRAIEELEGLLQMLYGEISYAGSDIAELLQNLERSSHYFRSLWKRLCHRIKQYDAGRLWEIWQEEFAREEWHVLKEEEKHILEELGRTLGQVDRQTQLHTLQLYQQRLGTILQQAREEYSGQARVYHVTGITAGCFLVILLL